LSQPRSKTLGRARALLARAIEHVERPHVPVESVGNLRLLHLPRAISRLFGCLELRLHTLEARAAVGKLLLLLLQEQ
jgi:hypothetical protein